MNKLLQQKFDDLEKQRQELFEQLGRYTDEQLNQSPGEGKWSPIQVIHHLIKSEGASMSYIGKKVQYKTRIPKLGLKNNIGYRFAIASMNSPIKISAPSYALPPESDTLEATWKKWDARREQLKTLLNDFPDDMLDKAVLKHPIGGRIGMKHTLGFFKVHVKRHSRQIDRML